MPFLVVGVEEGEDVFHDALRRVAEALVVVHVGAHIALRELLLRAVLVELHQLRDVEILRHLEAKLAEELDVLGEGGEPFLAADNVGGAHQMIVNGVCEMVGRDSVRLEENEVLVVFGDLKLASDEVGEGGLLVRIAVADDAENEGVACFKVRLDLVERDLSCAELLLAASVAVVLVPVLCLDLCLLIDGVHFLQLLLRGEDGVGSACLNELLCVYVVDRAALGLLVRAVDAVVANLAVLAEDRALVEADAVACKRANQTLCRAGNLTLCVGILNAEVEYAARLVRKALTDGNGEHAAEMHEAGGAGGKARNLCALGQVTLRIFCFHVLSGFRHVREEEGSKSGGKREIGIIHNV